VTPTPACPSCGRKVPDWLLCTSCTRILEGNLKALPELMRELRTTFTRQSQAGTGNGGKGAETALVFDENAATIQDEVINAIGSWVMVFELGQGDLWTYQTMCVCLPPFARCKLLHIKVYLVANSMQAWTDWLLQRINRIRGHDKASMFADEIADCVKRVRRAIDRPADRLYCGKCDICQSGLWAKASDDVVTCQSCAGMVPPIISSVLVTGRRDAMLEQATESLATRAEILTAVPGMYGVPINGDTFQSWVKRGRLISVGTRDGQATYRLGSALDLARETATRRRTA
jgi:hypothetical protein